MIALQYIKTAFFWLAVVAAVICLVDWLVRTRRISPFGPVARFFKQTVDPLMAPVERTIVRAGGMPTSAPWWTLVAVVIGGILVINLLDFVFRQAAMLAYVGAAGPGAIAKLLIAWTFQLLQLALLVRVVSGWIRVSPYSKWVRWSYQLTEWFLRPLRQFIPPIGPGIDITPIVAYFLLRLVGSLVLGML
jgi:YggT family protein